MKGFRVLGEPLFSRGLTARLGLGTRMTAGGVTLYTISGTVYDADGTTPVSGATIALGALSATSAANGTYTISNVPAGTSGSMTCTKTGYSWTAITVAAMSGNLTNQNFTNWWWAFGGIAVACVAPFQAKNAASQAGSYVNLKTPGTNDISLGDAPTWAQGSGWAMDGAADYLIATGLDPVCQTWSVVVSYTGLTAGANKNIVRCNSAVKGFGIAFGAATLGYYSGASLDIVAAPPASGYLAIAGNKAYRNGVVETGNIPGAAGAVGFAPYIGARNNEGSVIQYGQLTIERVAFYSSAITQAQVVGVGTAALPLLV